MTREFHDISSVSISILEKRFNELRKTQAYVPDKGFPFEDIGSLPVEALLMGRYFERIFQVEYWPTKPFKLFCLSTQTRKILIDVFGFHADCVGLVSRYELFPLRQSTPIPLDLNSQSHLYHAGRISGQKNIEFLIFTVFYLQLLFSKDIMLSLIGNYDNDYHRDLLGCQMMDYQIKIETIIESLPWVGEKPIIKTGFDESEWLKHIPTNGFFLSTSNLISEDFSVVSAQLQQIGQPQLLPWWGGFKDVSGQNIKHYPSSFIASSNESIPAINQKAKKFAINLIQSLDFKLDGQKSEPFVTIEPSREISSAYIEDRIAFNVKNKGEVLIHLINNELSKLTLSNAGQAILSECRGSLS